MFFVPQVVDPLNLISGGLGKVECVNNEPVDKGS